MKNFRIEAIILAIGLLLLGVFIEKGFSKFAEKDRSVTVKGLAEIEVPGEMIWEDCTTTSSVPIRPSPVS